MRILLRPIVMAWLLAACGGTSHAPFTYAERVSVHSVLPVQVDVANGYESDKVSGTSQTLFGQTDQQHFAESLRTELVRHGVFGSIAEDGGDGVFRIDVQFARMASFADSQNYQLTVFVTTEYDGDQDSRRYHVLFDDDDAAPVKDKQAAGQLMSLIMADIQQAVIDRKLRLKAHVKERRTDIPRMLVKW